VGGRTRGGAGVEEGEEGRNGALRPTERIKDSIFFGFFLSFGEGGEKVWCTSRDGGMGVTGVCWTWCMDYLTHCLFSICF
jgi:hypothetical protein